MAASFKFNRRVWNLEFVMALVIALIELMLMVVSRSTLAFGIPLKISLTICANMGCLSAFAIVALGEDLPIRKHLVHIGYVLARLYCQSVEMVDIAMEQERGEKSYTGNLLLSDKVPFIVAVAVVLLLLFEDDICKYKISRRLNQMVGVAVVKLKAKLGLAPTSSTSSLSEEPLLVKKKKDM